MNPLFALPLYAADSVDTFYSTVILRRNRTGYSDENAHQILALHKQTFCP
jgi:hypothetical protein